MSSQQVIDLPTAYDNIKEWTGIDFASSARAAEDRTRWKRIVVKSSVVPQRPCKVMR